MSEEKKKRYRVKIINSKDSLVYVPFPDLCVRYNSGWSEPLKIQEGGEIPLMACDPEDVRKSFLAGSLYKYLKTGWIEEIPEEIKPKPLTPIELAQIKAATPITGTGDIPLIHVPIPPKPISDKVDAEVTKSNLSESQSILSNFSLVKNYNDFQKLSYFLRLRYIKESNDISLLKEILQKTESSQLKNNITLKLGQLK